MEFSLSNLKIQTYITPHTTCSYVTSTKHPLVQWVPQKNTIKMVATKVRCMKNNTSLGVELKKELEEIENEWRVMNKCKDERSSLVDFLECLEKEAIMGDDEGREPFDYNRRAQIFDKSSKVFQALKQLHASSTTTTDSTTTQV